MGLFGIGFRGTPAPTGNVSQQSVSPTSSGGGTGTSTTTTTTVAGIRTTTGTIGSSGGAIGPSARTPAQPTITTVRNLQPDLLAPGIVREIRLPPIVRFISPSITPRLKKYEPDSLRVSQFKIANSKFEAVEKNGISVFRPEILSVMNFTPIDGTGKLGSRNNTESAEQLIKAQYQANETRAITIQRLMKDIRGKRDFRIQLDTIKSNFSAGLTSTKTTLSYFADLIDKIENVKDSLDPKEIPVSSFDTTKYLSLADFYNRKMLYPKSKFANFSDTKIVNQLLSDFRKILEGYSLSLFDLVDPDRRDDISPIKIDKTYTQTNGFTFTPASIRSETVPRLANKSNFFNQFLNSLPSNSDDRIKLLTHFLSKELRVSKEMGKVDVQKNLREKYQQGDSGNPFDNIIGEVGDTIFNEPRGVTNSLANLTLFNIDTNNLVLPFESVYVDSEDERKVYVPGSTYFVDSILTTSATGFNTQPYISFVNRFNNVFGDAKNTVETLLELNQTSNLSPTSVYDMFLTSFAEATSGLTNQNSVSKNQALTLALFKLANTDTTLKNLVFEYLLLLGLSSVSRADQKTIFEKLATELSHIRNFQFVKVAPTENPDLKGGQAVLRPYIEDLAQSIEDKVFALVNNLTNITLLDLNFARSVPSPTPGITPLAISGPILTLGTNLQIFGSMGTPKNSGYLLSFRRGELKESLLNNIFAIGPASSNICKEFIDVAVKLDQNASISSNQVYFLPDNSGRTRQNYFSTSTILLLIYETFSALVNRYAFSTFNKGTSYVEASATIDTDLIDGVSKIIKDITTVKPNIAKIFGFNLLNQTTNKPPPVAPFSLFNLDLSRERTRTPSASGQQNSLNVSILPTAFTSISPTLIGQTQQRIQPLLNTPAFGFGRALNVFPGQINFIGDFVKISEFRKTITSNKTKLSEEDKAVSNILHILSVMNKRLISSKELVIQTFTKTSLDNFIKSTGSSLTDVDLVRNPSQVRVSSWLLDNYDDRLAEAGLDDETLDVDTGYLLTDRIPVVNLNTMFSLLRLPAYRHRNQADFKIKLLTVGIPAGFSKNLSDRISRTAINETNFNDKQFDVVSINVYKRDARFDDLVFKPKKFIFDLSLFPVKNFLPASLLDASVNFNTVVRDAILRDYESLKNKKNVTLSDIRSNIKYNFLSPLQKFEMVRNHVQSSLLELYFRLIAGIRMNEETFSGTTFTKFDTQDEKVLNLIISFLKNVRGKDIPNQPISQLLSNPNLDQETKDTLRLLSYGNIIFQPEFIKRRILEPKLFDRVFHVPVGIDDFEIDVETTLSTESGKNTYSKNSVQNMIYDVDGKKYLQPRNRNDIIFEDYFVVIETNLSAGGA
jgi:hypothetical protein